MAKNARSIRLIINADDLGDGARINDAIFQMMNKGVVTSATMLCNAPGFENAAKRSADYPHCSFGAHLYLSQFAPITDHPALDTIKGEDGRFDQSIRSVEHSAEFREAVYREWTAQVEKILDHGVRLSHLDSHHEVHTLPSLFMPLKRLQRRFGIRRLRITRNMYSDYRPPATRSLIYKKALWIMAVRYYYRTITTAGNCDFDAFLDMAKKGQINRDLIELITHPGHHDFAEENEMMESDWRSQLPFEVELISFNDI
jgi:predicted glycoside hydrolase/deacetylase ChbG (UPF0249 family)